MRKKRTSLDEFIRRDVRPSPAGPAAAQPAAPPRPPRREKVKGTRQQSVYIPVPAYRQLRKLAFDEDGKMHNYLIHGLDLVFREKGLPSIAELKARGEA